VWEIVNGGGGWVHPVHLHEEEHRVLMRDGLAAPDPSHPDDMSREDVVALEGGESVILYRKFRTFTSHYVTHCHNLAHEDHAMMFGWTIVGDNQTALPQADEFPRFKYYLPQMFNKP
jgi:FtsP/CotA-like multicopper oxidase with cupredoxin domain